MSFVHAFQEMKRIYGFCPCCGELFRLSDATIYSRDRPPETDFDRVEQKRRSLERSIEAFDERVAEIRQAAVEAGQRQARKRLRSIAPFFVDRKVDPQDVKVIFDPVRYLAFPGLRDGHVRSVQLIDGPPLTRSREKIQRSIERCITGGNLEWHTYRVDGDGRITQEE